MNVVSPSKDCLVLPISADWVPGCSVSDLARLKESVIGAYQPSAIAQSARTYNSDLREIDTESIHIHSI